MKSYCPYSKFSVKCTIYTKDNKIYEGVNVENASYGLTSCAEANAIAAYISDTPRRKSWIHNIRSIRIETQCAPFITPCGACRQILAEHISDNVPIICTGSSKEKIFYINELLPYAFKLSKL